jgi:hypothetical protein
LAEFFICDSLPVGIGHEFRTVASALRVPMLEELEQGTLVAPMAPMFSHPHNATSVNVAPMAPMTNQQ